MAGITFLVGAPCPGMPFGWPRAHLVLVRTTLPTRTAAQALARRLIDRRVAGCAHVTETASTYRWKGKVEEETEFVVEARTTLQQQAQVVRMMEEGHPYETPLVEAWSVSMVPQRYAAWLAGEVR